MLIELLQPATPELARRWLAALLLVPAAERDDVVRAVEAKISYAYGRRAAGSAGKNAGANVPQAFDVVHPPTQREGFVEQVITTYERAPEPDAASAVAKRGKRTKRGGSAG